MKTKDELYALRAELVCHSLVLKTQRTQHSKYKNYFSAARIHAEIEAIDYAVCIVDRFLSARRTKGR